MIWVDYCILGVTLVSIIIGAFRGVVREVLGLLTWAVAFLAAALFHNEVAGLLQSKISNPALCTAAGWAGTFLAGLLVGAIISSVLVEAVRNSTFSGADRTIGAGFGLLRGLLLTAIFLLVAGSMGEKKSEWWQRSLFVSKLEWLADGLGMVVPQSWLEKLNPDAAPTKGS
ncbi:MAG TPA: CvpA family protein [Nevskiaceae bacterium]|nr:CvpA family protein [Nevskiaceae bacterium]